MPNNRKRLPSADERRSPLLISGLVAALLFNSLVLAQAVIRPEYDLVRMPLSLLALGHGGWVQTLNFVITGFLIMAAAIGVRATRSPGTGNLAGPVLLAFYGAGMAVAGFFPADPINGFPVGAHATPALTANAQLHGFGFMVAHLAVIIASLVFAFRFWRLSRKGWAAYCVITALGVPLLIVLGFASEEIRGLAFFLTGIASMSWLALLTRRLGTEAALPD
ncbi:MAG: DUF998 domain-containing protein [Sphingosinicella sp.]|nr:DUF998 domain-containing protein [Sphingosinicella sp.]